MNSRIDDLIYELTNGWTAIKTNIFINYGSILCYLNLKQINFSQCCHREDKKGQAIRLHRFNRII